jgi:hypothetical protein
MALRDMRLAVLVERIHTILDRSFTRLSVRTPMSVRRFFDRFVDDSTRVLGRYWSVNDAARAEAETSFTAGWRVVFFDPKYDFPHSFPQIPMPCHFL